MQHDVMLILSHADKVFASALILGHTDTEMDQDRLGHGQCVRNADISTKVSPSP